MSVFCLLVDEPTTGGRRGGGGGQEQERKPTLYFLYGVFSLPEWEEPCRSSHVVR